MPIGIASSREDNIMTTKQCGNCEFWDNVNSTLLPNGRSCAACVIALPKSVVASISVPMLDIEGNDCQLYEVRS